MTPAPDNCPWSEFWRVYLRGIAAELSVFVLTTATAAVGPHYGLPWWAPAVLLGFGIGVMSYWPRILLRFMLRWRWHREIGYPFKPK